MANPATPVMYVNRLAPADAADGISLDGKLYFSSDADRAAFAAHMSAIVGSFVLTSGSYSDPTWITTLGFSKLTGAPTTLSGYGITDAVPATRTVNGHALSANVTVTAADLGLVIGTNVQAFSSVLSSLSAGSPLTQGTNVMITGTWPNLTISAAGGSGFANPATADLQMGAWQCKYTNGSITGFLGYTGLGIGMGGAYAMQLDATTSTVTLSNGAILLGDDGSGNFYVTATNFFLYGAPFSMNDGSGFGGGDFSLDGASLKLNNSVNLQASSSIAIVTAGTTVFLGTVNVHSNNLVLDSAEQVSIAAPGDDSVRFSFSSGGLTMQFYGNDGTTPTAPLSDPNVTGYFHCRDNGTDVWLACVK